MYKFCNRQKETAGEMPAVRGCYPSNGVSGLGELLGVDCLGDAQPQLITVSLLTEIDQILDGTVRKPEIPNNFIPFETALPAPREQRNDLI